MNLNDWSYNASYWRKQITGLVESLFNTIGWTIITILSAIGLLFLFNKLAWQWYKLNVEIRANNFLSKCEEELYKVLYGIEEEQKDD